MLFVFPVRFNIRPFAGKLFKALVRGSDKLLRAAVKLIGVKLKLIGTRIVFADELRLVKRYFKPVRTRAVSGCCDEGSGGSVRVLDLNCDVVFNLNVMPLALVAESPDF